MNGQRLSQVAQFLRATDVKVFNRKNLQTVVRFSVTRQHDTAGAAEVFLLEHDLDLPPTGLVTFVAQDGVKEVERYLKDAMVTVSDREYIGASTIHQYTILGGQLLTQRPT